MEDKVRVEDVILRLIECAKLKNMQELASALGVSSNAISGWKARNSLGIVFEYVYPFLLKNNISLYYIFFGIGEKNLHIEKSSEFSKLEGRIKKIEDKLGI